MLRIINSLLDWMSEYFAHRKGLLPLMGIVLVLLNLIVNAIWGSIWLAETDLLLHLGVIIAILGVLIAWAL
jgi:hypothetical protein